MKKYFFTFGTNNFRLQKKHITYLAKKIDIFDVCLTFGPKDIDSDFKRKYWEIFKFSKGYGFWFWKYYFIEKLLSSANVGDILVYSDAGSSIDLAGKARLNEYFEILNNSKTGNLRFQMGQNKEKYYTSKELFNYFNLKPDSQIGNTGQLVGGHILIKKNENSKLIINEFKKIIDYDYKLITDDYNNLTQIKNFHSCKNDQSIFSLLSKVYGAEILKDETALNDDFPENKIHPFRAVQIKKYTLYQKFKFYLNYKKNINRTITFNRKEYWFQKDSLFLNIKKHLKKYFKL